MYMLKIVRSSSYQLELPEQICEQIDEQVSSFWLEGNPLLLQVSSYLRNKGKQVSAQERLTDRIKKHKYKWTKWKTKIYAGTDVDQATAQFIDEDGLLWLHSYLVWSHLAIYSTISGPQELVTNSKNWAVESLKSIKLIIH
jgi:hypothetical protein